MQILLPILFLFAFGAIRFLLAVRFDGIFYPPKWWFFGYGFTFLSGKLPYAIQELHNKYGKFVQIGPQRISINSHKALRDIYGIRSTKTGFPTKIGFYEQLPGRKTIFSESDRGVHLRTRKLVAPSFTPAAVKQYHGIILHKSRELVDKIRSRRGISNVRHLSFKELLHCYVIDVLGEVVLGKSFNSLTEEKPHPLMSQLRLIFFWALTFDLFAGTGLPWLMKRCRRLLRGQTLKKYANDTLKLIKDQFGFISTDSSILQESLRRQQDSDMSDSQVVDTFRDILLGGIDTTHTALCFTLYLIASTPSVHNKLTAELRTKFSKTSDLSQEFPGCLVYLDAVISEALRLYPSIAFGLPRKSPGMIIDDKYIPQGVEVNVPIYALNRNPNYFHDPNEFQPERWINPGNGDSLDASQPFSIGTRACIGKSVALLILRLAVTCIFLEFDAICTEASKDWQSKLSNYIVWEVPDLDIQFSVKSDIHT